MKNYLKDQLGILLLVFSLPIFIIGKAVDDYSLLTITVCFLGLAVYFLLLFVGYAEYSRENYVSDNRKMTERVFFISGIVSASVFGLIMIGICLQYLILDPFGIWKEMFDTVFLNKVYEFFSNPPIAAVGSVLFITAIILIVFVRSEERTRKRENNRYKERS